MHIVNAHRISSEQYIGVNADIITSSSEFDSPFIYDRKNRVSCDSPMMKIAVKVQCKFYICIFSVQNFYKSICRIKISAVALKIFLETGNTWFLLLNERKHSVFIFFVVSPVIQIKQTDIVRHYFK